MRLLLVAVVSLAVLQVILADKNANRFRHKQSSKWQAFKSRVRSMNLKNDHEEEARFENFMVKDAQFALHNEKFASGDVSFTLEHNELSVMTPDEIENTKLGLIPVESFAFARKRALSTWQPDRNKAIPASVDLVERFGGDNNWPIRNQETCGSCWAFTAIDAFESAMRLQSGNTIRPDFSQEFLVDCDNTNNGVTSAHTGPTMNNKCSGGDPRMSADEVIQGINNQKGLPLATDYPYSQESKSFARTNVWTFPGTEQCRKLPRHYGNNFQKVVTMTGEQDTMRAVDQLGSVMTCVFSDSKNFPFYSGGILTETAASKNEKAAYLAKIQKQYGAGVRCPCNHAVSIVGYGTDAKTGQKFWKVRNSWGTNGYGVKGYWYLARDGVNWSDQLTSPTCYGGSVVTTGLTKSG